VPAMLRPYLPSQVWLEERRRKWGEGSPLWTSKVEGRFPENASDGVILWSWLRKCQTEPKIGDLRVPVELGVDVAGSDVGDETVVYERMGGKLARRWSVRSSDPEDVLRCVENAVVESGPSRVKVDAIGVGWGIVAGLRRSFPQLDVVAVNVSEAAPDPTKFKNLRAHIWWEVGRSLAQDQAIDLAGWPGVPDDETDALLLELATPKFSEVNGGRIQIESKDDIRKRLEGRSTDNADAMLLAFYDPPTDEVTETEQDRSAVLDDGFR
jgi:hypothetical protein